MLSPESLDPILVVGSSWLLTLLVAAWLIVLFVRRRYLFVKPSILLISFHHILLQWPSLAVAPDIVFYLPDPWPYLFATHMFPLLGLAVASNTFHARAKMVWDRITAPGYLAKTAHSPSVLLLAAVVALLAGYYLSVVPLRSTGLYSIILNPALAALAREQSLKLLDNRAAAYAYLLLAQSAAPLLAAVLTLAIARRWRAGVRLPVLAPLVAVLVLLVLVSLSGARVFSVNMLLVVLLSVLFLRGLPFSPIRVATALALILVPAAALTLAREGRASDVVLLGDYLLRRVGTRVFSVPIDTGVWYLHYAQTLGEVGIAGVPKLAALLGVPIVDIPNAVGLRYETDPLATVNTVTGFVYSYFAYFGYPSVVLSLVGLWAIDGALLVYQRLSDGLLLPVVAVVTRSTLSFVDTDFTIVLVSQGFLVTLVLALGVDAVARYMRMTATRPV